MGHENGGWMNDDQRGEMRERARVAETLGRVRRPRERRAMFRCTNPDCGEIHPADPQGHCPACKQSDGSGWSCVPVAPAPAGERSETMSEPERDGVLSPDERAALEQFVEWNRTRWTKATPAEPGWYWWRESIAHHAKVVWVSTTGGAAEAFSFATSPARTLGGEWWGPLQEPGVDAIENCQ